MTNFQTKTLSMWKEDLPERCPTNKAIDYEGSVFRVTKTNTPSIDDFKVYAKLYPDNPRYKQLCEAYAISFYDTLSNAKEAVQKSIERNNKLGDYIAHYNLCKDDGKSHLNGSSGHINTWFYSKSQFDIFSPINISEVNED